MPPSGQIFIPGASTRKCLHKWYVVLFFVINSFHQPQNYCSCRLLEREVFARQSLTEFEQYKTSNTAGVLLGARLNIWGLLTYCNLGIFRFGFFWVHWALNFRGLWYFVGNKPATVFTKYCKMRHKKVRFCPWRSNLRRQLPLDFRQHLGSCIQWYEN